MTRILVLLALLLTGCAAHAQTSCSVQSQATLLSQFSDNADQSSITPQNMRNVICSSVNQAGPFTPAALAGATTGIFTNTQMNTPFTFLLNGLSPLTEYQSVHFGQFATQALVGGVTIPSNATVGEGDALAGYVVNNASGAAGVGGLFISQAGAAGTQNFGLNVVVADNNLAAQNVIAAEFDIGCYNVLTACLGINMKLVSPFQTPTLFGYAFQSSATGTDYGWQVGFNCAEAGALTCLSVAPLNSGASHNSAPIAFDAIDAASANPTCAIQEVALTAGGNLQLSCSNGAVSSTVPIQLGPLTIATLPTCNSGTAGEWTYISNGIASPTYRQAVSSTGSAGQFVGCDGSNWLYH